MFSAFKNALLGDDGISIEEIEKDAQNVEGKISFRENSLSDYDYFMKLAMLTAERSKDPVTQVGAVVVSENGDVLGLGYNRMPINCSDHRMPWGKDSENPLENKFMFVCHAESNAVLDACHKNNKPHTIFTTRGPCNECAKTIIMAGIRRVVYLEEKPAKLERMAAKFLFEEAGVVEE